MDRRQLLILLLGPVPIVTGSLALSRWARPNPEVAPKPNHVVMFADKSLADEVPATAAAIKPNRPALQGAAEKDLAVDCRKTASQIGAKLGAECSVAVHSPFVVAGDLSRQELDRWMRDTIGPASRAMANCYFSKPPTRPITVLLFRSEESYNHYAKEVFGDEGISVYGYYKPNLRTLVMNIGTGGGTLVHELTHALIDFDFPEAPDWFNEGLASLHEQCSIRPDESGIDGLENWRLRGLQETIRRGKLRSLEALIYDKDFRGAEVGLNYAQARYFCLYLQRSENPRGTDVLPEFYRSLRAGRTVDPRGASALRKVFPELSWAELDKEFQAWALNLRAP